MVFNVLWLSAVAAAAMMAGFCMGRLTMRMENTPEEESGRDRRLQRRAGWEMEAAGEAAVRVDNGQWKAGAEEQWIQRADRTDGEVVPEKSQSGTGNMYVRTGKTDVERMRVVNTESLRADRSRSALGTAERAGEYVGEGQRQGRTERLRPGTVERLTNAARAAVNSNSRRLRAVGRFPGRRIPQAPEGQSWTVGSPVLGYVTSYREGEHPSVVICPAEDRLYAPVAGKIIKLFPMGNAFLFRTEFGAELYIRAGETNDDLLGRYFRPRVVQNEIVSKGKLLLEFDRQGLGMEGASAMVTVRVESKSYGSSVALEADEKVRPGEELLRVTERPESDIGRLI